MATQILMPALSPTMEEGKLSKWLVKEGDTVKSGDILAEIETDKATMEFEAVDEGKIGQIGLSEVSVTAECTAHGRWSSTRSINIPAGGGGCADPSPLPDRPRDSDIRPPALRIPQLLKRGRLTAGGTNSHIRRYSHIFCVDSLRVASAPATVLI